MGFYCENCGKEVKRNSDSCPSCGVHFKAVKCPSCGFTDKAEYFKGGCPSCGYLSADERISLDADHSGDQEKKPILGFIPNSVFWLLSLILLLFLLILFFQYLK